MLHLTSLPFPFFITRENLEKDENILRPHSSMLFHNPTGLVRNSRYAIRKKKTAKNRKLNEGNIFIPVQYCPLKIGTGKDGAELISNGGL